MFINLENGKLKLYDLKIYKGMDDIKRKLILESPYDIKKEETTYISYQEEQIINNGRDMIKFISSTPTGKWVESRDELQYPSARVYNYQYFVFHLNEIYQILKRVTSRDYKALQNLNQYINNEFNTNDQEIFEKYRKRILRNLFLIEYVNEESRELVRVYEMLLKNSKGSLKSNLEKLKEHVLEIDIDKIPKKIKR